MAAQTRRRQIARIRERKRKEMAFSMIEIMLGVTIVGVLAAIGSERYSAYVAQARRAEAYAAIDALWNAQEAFYAEHGLYNPNLRIIGFRLDQGNYVTGAPNQYQGKHYHYVVRVDPNFAQEWMVRATSGAGGNGQDIDGDAFPDVIVSGKLNSFNVN